MKQRIDLDREDIDRIIFALRALDFSETVAYHAISEYYSDTTTNTKTYCTRLGFELGIVESTRIINKLFPYVNPYEKD